MALQELGAGKYEQVSLSSVPSTIHCPSAGPSELEVPMPNLCKTYAMQNSNLVEQLDTAAQVGPSPGAHRSPLPSGGSRRDACGTWSVGSEGHHVGLCRGPCKDLRSARGCTFGKKCKLCHLPHPEISSSSIRKQRFLAKKAMKESLMGNGLARGEHGEWFSQGGQDGFSS
eukprot:TRINITY_DN7153_c0_g2_i1.p1 TRINITY_DN7153_c0_g2~~TRINITY_DN7153_c0_g2_i1.p1  ORF type:complete len:183 (+),score=15.13 TRINITY_DN7153_c0_g2_i1:37-549(+)